MQLPAMRVYLDAQEPVSPAPVSVLQVSKVERCAQVAESWCAMMPSEQYAREATHKAKIFWPGDDQLEISISEGAFHDIIRLAFLEGAQKAIDEVNNLAPVGSVADVAPGWVTP